MNAVSDTVELPSNSFLDFLSRNRLWVLIAVGIIIRLVFMGWLDLLPEEAYYWSYSQHMDIGYLDHPPMVAWLIAASEAVFGRSEFAVRLPAFLGWFLLAFFLYRLAEDLVGKGNGVKAVLLLAALPIYVSVGFLMTPDAPFYVAWAGCLLFLERALVRGRAWSWLGAGTFLGLGLLSKYTMGLIVPACVLFVLLDKKSRFWLKRVHPYLALLIGFILFLPDLYWNYTHDWVSFAFQGARRWSGEQGFYLHILIGSVLVLITPIGAYAAYRALKACWKYVRKPGAFNPDVSRRHLFMLVFSVAPLLVFVMHSLQGQPKLNWTGPVWMVLLPLMWVSLAGRKSAATSSETRHPRVWVVTATSLLLFYTGGFAYLVAGLPGAPKGSGMKLPIAWRMMGHRVHDIESKLESQTGSEPIIAGLDMYHIASQMSFYDPDHPASEEKVRGDHEGEPPEFGARELFEGSSLMWDYWAPPQTARSRDILLLSFTPHDLDQPWVTRHFAKLDDIYTEVLQRHDSEMCRFYWRVGYNYHE